MSWYPESSFIHNFFPKFKLDSNRNFVFFGPWKVHHSNGKISINGYNSNEGVPIFWENKNIEGNIIQSKKFTNKKLPLNWALNPKNNSQFKLIKFPTNLEIGHSAFSFKEFKIEEMPNNLALKFYGNGDVIIYINGEKVLEKYFMIDKLIFLNLIRILVTHLTNNSAASPWLKHKISLGS